MSDFSAIYLPALPPKTPDPSRSGFATKEEAEKYLLSQMCITCQGERERFEAGTGSNDFGSDDYADSWPACACEWLIVPTEKANGNLDELMEAAGWETVYRKPDA